VFRAEELEQQAARTNESPEILCRAIRFVLLPVVDKHIRSGLIASLLLRPLRKELMRYLERNCNL
jgi:hypothetical protein